MATKVYTEEEIELQDGTLVTLKPLPIGRLRRFMEAWNKITELPDGDDGFDVFINAAGIGLEANFRDKFDTLKASKEEAAEGEFLSPEYKSYLEDNLDLDTAYKVLDVTGGIKLDPKAMMQALESQAME